VLAIKSLETNETLERWQFDIQREEESPNSAASAAGSATTTGKGVPQKKKKEKTEKEVQGEIREIMKQITSSVTFLPILEEPCERLRWLKSMQKTDNEIGTFTLLAYTNNSPDVAIPTTWDDADPHLIDRGKVEQVRLRSFSTNVHSLEVRPAISSHSKTLTTLGYGRIQGGRVTGSADSEGAFRSIV